MSGATSRTRKLAAAAGSSSMIRWEPSIIPSPNSCAARARFRLIDADAPAPPVIAPITSGARSRRPKSRTSVRIAARSVSGSAL
jgi:hypothetical protein